MNLFTFLAAAVGPLAVRVLTALGITAITFVGVDTVVGQLVTLLNNSYGGFPAKAFAVCQIAGMGQGIGLVVGAINARLALWTAASATKWITSAPG